MEVEVELQRTQRVLRTERMLRMLRMLRILLSLFALSPQSLLLLRGSNFFLISDRFRDLLLRVHDTQLPVAPFAHVFRTIKFDG